MWRMFSNVGVIISKWRTIISNDVFSNVEGSVQLCGGLCSVMWRAIMIFIIP